MNKLSNKRRSIKKGPDYRSDKITVQLPDDGCKVQTPFIVITCSEVFLYDYTELQDLLGETTDNNIIGTFTCAMIVLLKCLNEDLVCFNSVKIGGNTYNKEFIIQGVNNTLNAMSQAILSITHSRDSVVKLNIEKSQVRILKETIMPHLEGATL
jgi:hypothetical protein